jgi:hypothetical protein
LVELLVGEVEVWHERPRLDVLRALEPKPHVRWRILNNAGS